jgi:Flp pilus assembly protein CpaB
MSSLREQYGFGPGDEQGLRPKTLILLLIAIGCGLAAAALTSQVVGNNRNTSDSNSQVNGFTAVVVARKDIGAGTAVQDPAELFKIVHYRTGDEPREAITSLESMKGKVVIRALAEDQPVKAKDLN